MGQMKKAKVSIIVPIYNSGKYLKNCLDSLTQQTLREIEIICIDDGSTDQSGEILKKYAAVDERIKIVNQKNAGRSGARNAGLRVAKSELIMFCDSDDEYRKNMCEKMVKAVSEYNVGVAICGIEMKYEVHNRYKEDDQKYYEIKFSGIQKIDENVIIHTDTSVCNKIFRRSLIDKNQIRFPEGLNNEDYYFYNAYMVVAKNAMFLQEKYYIYTRHEGSIMSNNFQREQYSPDHLLVSIQLFKFYKKNSMLIRYRNLFWMQFVESFWFSYNYSARKFRRRIVDIARDFIRENYKICKPSNKRVKLKVFLIIYGKIYYRIIMRVRAKLRSLGG